MTKLCNSFLSQALRDTLPETGSNAAGLDPQGVNISTDLPCQSFPMINLGPSFSPVVFQDELSLDRAQQLQAVIETIQGLLVFFVRLNLRGKFGEFPLSKRFQEDQACDAANIMGRITDKAGKVRQPLTDSIESIVHKFFRRFRSSPSEETNQLTPDLFVDLTLQVLNFPGFQPIERSIADQEVEQVVKPFGRAWLFSRTPVIHATVLHLLASPVSPIHNVRNNWSYDGSGINHETPGVSAKSHLDATILRFLGQDSICRLEGFLARKGQGRCRFQEIRLRLCFRLSNIGTRRVPMIKSSRHDGQVSALVSPPLILLDSFFRSHPVLAESLYMTSRSTYQSLKVVREDI